jgi:hypothetical protein
LFWTSIQDPLTVDDDRFSRGVGVEDIRANWVGIKGRFQGRRTDGHPCTEALWHGLQQLDVAVRMYLTFLPHERHEMRTEYPLDYLQPPAQDSS